MLDSKLWDEYLDRARDFIADGRLDAEEVSYKLAIGRDLAGAREAVLSGDSSTWLVLVRKALRTNLSSFYQHVVLWNWFNDQPSDASEAMRAIWSQDSKPVDERIRAFLAMVPEHPTKFRGTGTRLREVSILLMALGPEQYPPFKVTEFNGAYRAVGHPPPPNGADEGELYQHALGFLDKLVDKARARGFDRPSNRLEAQSVVWKNESKPDPTPINGTSVASPIEDKAPEPEPLSQQDLANQLHLPTDFLENIEALLEDKKQVIFQGPPGTGKTFVAQALAEHLAGPNGRVTLVQLHPSYAYEDFVQGFRPTLKNGQPGFELRDGPLLRAAKLARDDQSGAKHFLVIDEINRGNLAKVLGELYFLLEYRDKKIRLQYHSDAEEDFSLPPNLYFIGTMNTADRSIALVDLALRRRFYFVEFHPDDEPVKGVLRRWIGENAPGMEWVANVVERANVLLQDDRHAAIGPSYFMKDGLDETAVERIWKHSVLSYIEERLFGDDDRIREFDLSALRGPEGSGGPGTATGSEEATARDEDAAGSEPGVL